jgi:hypothetical protein
MGFLTIFFFFVWVLFEIGVLVRYRFIKIKKIKIYYYYYYYLVMFIFVLDFTCGFCIGFCQFFWWVLIKKIIIIRPHLRVSPKTP